MDDLPALIHDLDDATAERILATVAQHRLRSGTATALTPAPDLGRALADAAGTAPSSATVSAGDLARHSLLLLADDPAQHEALRGLIENPPARSFVDPLTAIAVGTAALCILQTYVEIERDPKKGWSIKIKKRPTSEKLLQLLIEKVSRYLPGL
jgi:hypothetical protein